MKQKLLYIFSLSFIFNWLWENLHAVLYYHPNGEPMTQIMLLQATLFDAVFITLIAVLFLKIQYFKKRLFLIIILGIVIAIFIETYALQTNLWAYTQAMPIIPFINTGITPTIQLGLISYIVYKLVNIKQNETFN